MNFKQSTNETVRMIDQLSPAWMLKWIIRLRRRVEYILIVEFIFSCDWVETEVLWVKNHWQRAVDWNPRTKTGFYSISHCWMNSTPFTFLFEWMWVKRHNDVCTYQCECERSCEFELFAAAAVVVVIAVFVVMIFVFDERCTCVRWRIESITLAQSALHEIHETRIWDVFSTTLYSDMFSSQYSVVCAR